MGHPIDCLGDLGPALRDVRYQARLEQGLYYEYPNPTTTQRNSDLQQNL